MLQTQEQPFSRAGSGCTHIKVDQRQWRLHIAVGRGARGQRWDLEEVQGAALEGIWFCLDFVFLCFACSERQQ